MGRERTVGLVIDLLIYLLLSIGVPLSEEFARPTAERLELTCQREAWQWIDWPERCRECAKLPSIVEAELLPPVALAEEYALLNACHACWLEAQQSMSHDWFVWQQWRNENAALGRWWQSARDARRPIYCLITRRHDLARAKALTEPEDWWAMRWPECVVWGRFR
jgi:hypothetical protein